MGRGCARAAQRGIFTRYIHTPGCRTTSASRWELPEQNDRVLEAFREIGEELAMANE
jgi:hypothetical protein